MKEERRKDRGSGDKRIRREKNIQGWLVVEPLMHCRSNWGFWSIEPARRKTLQSGPDQVWAWVLQVMGLKCEAN